MITEKLKWIFALLVVFLLVLGTNLVDRKNFNQVKASIVTIYEDRLVVKDLIFDLYQLMEQKEVALIKQDTFFYFQENSGINQSMSALIALYENTKLTPLEEEEFTNFQANVSDLQTLEMSFVKAQTHTASKSEVLIKKINQLKNNLRALADIQIEEGKRQMHIGQKAVASVDLLTRLEVIFLIIIALIIQALILYQPKESEVS